MASKSLTNLNAQRQNNRELDAVGSPGALFFCRGGRSRFESHISSVAQNRCVERLAIVFNAKVASGVANPKICDREFLQKIGQTFAIEPNRTSLRVERDA